jgi:hypothetical protein
MGFAGRKLISSQVGFPQLGQDIVFNYYGSGAIEVGESVSMNSDGNRVAIGAPSWEVPATGAVAIYSWDGTSWVQLGQDIPMSGAAPEWAKRVAISLNSAGDRVVVGDLRYNDGGSDEGQVRVYSFNGTSWVQLGNSINGVGDQYFGFSVSMNAVGDRIIVGSPYADPFGRVSAGAATIYSWDGISWGSGRNIFGQNSGDWTGCSVSMNSAGNRAAIGSPGFTMPGTGGNIGAVAVYAESGGAWNKMADQDIYGRNSGDHGGLSVSLNSAGDRVAFGGVRESFEGNGITRIYFWNGTSWGKAGEDILGKSSGEQNGRSVSMNSAGSRVAIGSPYAKITGYPNGLVRVYQL